MPHLNIRKRSGRRLSLEPLERRIALDASMLLDINSTPVARGSYPRQFTEINDAVYFLTNDLIGDELWMVSQDSAEKLVDFDLDLFVEGIFPGHLRKIDQIRPWDSGIELLSGTKTLYLADDDQLSLVHEGPLMDAGDWRFTFNRNTGSIPGTTESFVSHELVAVSPQGSSRRLFNSFEASYAGDFTSHFAVLNNQVITAHSGRLGVSDGTTDGTLSIDSVTNPGVFQRVGDLAYFFGGDHGGFALWQTDGTAANTKHVADVFSPSSGEEFGKHSVRQALTDGNRLYFVFSELTKTEPFRLWTSDGETTTPLIEVPFTEQLGAPVTIGARTLLAEVGLDTRAVGENRVPFYGKLIATDGTPENTVRVIDNQATLHSDPSFTVWNDIAYFLAFTPDEGYELWRTDGTDIGTNIVRDINPGSGSSHIRDLRIWEDKLLFVAESELGRELWMSDGTAAGTRPVTDIAVGPNSSNPTGFFVYQDQLLFLAETASQGQELWATDGTSDGTRILRDINPGTGNSGPDQFHAFNDQLVFVAYSDASGSEFWTTDGTPGGTRMLMDLAPGPASTLPNNIAVIDDLIYFSSNGGDTGFEPWVTDGTPEGTRLIRNIVEEGTDSATPRELTVVGDHAFFSADDGVHGQELWITDGTADGTQLVLDIAAGPVSSDISDITAVGPHVYFTAADSIHGRELWISDGTSEGTRMVADIVNGPVGSAPLNITAAGDSVYFVAFDFDHGDELWTSDGTAEGTYLVADVAAGEDDAQLRDLTALDGKLYFVASTLEVDRSSPEELWVSDGSADGTHPVDPIPRNCLWDNRGPNEFVVLESELYFLLCGRLNVVTSTGSRYIEKGIDDDRPSYWLGTNRSTGSSLVLFDDQSQRWFEYVPPHARITSFNAYDQASLDPVDGQIAYFGDRVFAQIERTSDYQTTSIGLWAFPRDSAKAFEIRDVDDSMNRIPISFEIIDDTLYLVAEHKELGRELWRSDGTTSGTYVITDIAPLGFSSHPSEIIQLGDQLLFRATNDSSGIEIWTIDIPQRSLEFSSRAYTISEDPRLGNPPINAVRSGPLDKPLQFEVNFVPDTASPPDESDPDYLALSQTYTFAVGQDTIAISPAIVDDDRIEPDERLWMELVVESNAIVKTNLRSQSALTIVTDDRPPTGDVDNDGLIAFNDLNLLVERIGRGDSIPPFYDINFDDRLDIRDVERWLEIAGTIFHPRREPFRFGDANLDGNVDATDWQLSFSDLSNTSLPWTIGRDFNADGVNDGSDFNIWLDNRFQPPAANQHRARIPRAALPHEKQGGGSLENAALPPSRHVDRTAADNLFSCDKKNPFTASLERIESSHQRSSASLPRKSRTSILRRSPTRDSIPSIDQSFEVAQIDELLAQLAFLD